MFTLTFWKAAGERAAKSGAQFVLLILGTGVIAGTVEGGEAQVINAFALDYLTLLGAFVGGAIISVMTSLVSAPISGSGPSLTTAETLNVRGDHSL